MPSCVRTAVDGDRRTGDEVPTLPGRIRDGGRDLCRRRIAAECRGRALGLGVRACRGAHIGIGGTGQDHIDDDSARAEVAVEALGEADERGLGPCFISRGRIATG